MLSPAERIDLLKLMEMQRHAQLMYTSCGWFFDDISGIETVQVIAYAARAIQLAAEVFLIDRAQMEEHFLEILSQAQSNVPEWKNGAEIYRRLVKPLEVTLEQVAAHYAISSFFSNYSEETTLFCYAARRMDYDVLASGHGRLAIGRVRITSNITEESEEFSFAALNFGDQNVTAAVKSFAPKNLSAFNALKKKCAAAVTLGNLPDVVRLIDRYFGGSPYSLVSVFGDDQRRILKVILQSTLGEVERSLASIYEQHASLLRFLSAAKLPRPPALNMAAGFAINAGLRRALEDDPMDLARVHSLITLAKEDKVSLDQYELSYLADQHMKRAMVSLQANPLDIDLLERTLAMARTLRELPFRLNLWQAQNIWDDMLNASLKLLKPLDASSAERWRELFFELGRQLWIAVEELVVEDASVETEDESPAQEVASAP